MEPLTLTIKDAAKAIGIGRVTLYKHINAGLIETTKIGGRRLVKVSSLRRLVDGHQSAPVADTPLP